MCGSTLTEYLSMAVAPCAELECGLLAVESRKSRLGENQASECISLAESLRAPRSTLTLVKQQPAVPVPDVTHNSNMNPGRILPVRNAIPVPALMTVQL